MSTFLGSRAQRLLLLTAGLASACVATELSLQNDDPGNAHARSGKLPALTDLRGELDGSRGAPKTKEPHDHGAHDHGATGREPAPEAEGSKDAAEVVYTCPMHPEIERSAPGTCPKCGMKLVPKKGKP